MTKTIYLSLDPEGHVESSDFPRSHENEDFNIVVDDEGFLVCGESEDDLFKAFVFGRAAGYKLRKADADRLEVESDE